MKNLLIIVISGLCIACGGSKQLVAKNQKVEPSEKDSTSKIEMPIEEKAPDTPVTEVESQSGTEQIKDQASKVIKPSKNDEKSDAVKIQIPIEEKSPYDLTEEPKINNKPQVQTEREKPKTVSKPLNHGAWTILLNKHVSKDGTVNYKGFKQDAVAFRKYLNQLRDNIPTSDWNKKDELAYWMNAYNAFTVKLIIDNYPIKSIKDIKDPWDLRFFRLGKKWYTLNDIEHRILRKMGDPRIHFGINCASFSCPPLLNKAFTPQNVDQELEKLATTFINDPKRNTITTNKIQLSKIFSWFAKDFKKQGTLIDFLNKYSKVTINNAAKKSFKNYDWTLNE